MSTGVNLLEDGVTDDSAADTGEGSGADQGAAGQGETPPAGDGKQSTDGATNTGGTGDGAAGDAGATEDAGAEDTEVVPESYEFSLPEGFSLNEAINGEFVALAKDLKLSQPKAQQVIDLGVKLAQNVADSFTAQIEAERSKWVEQTKSDPDFGGAALKENLAIAKRGRDAYASAGLTTLLNESGLGNHPEVVRLFLALGKTVKEDSFVPSGDASGTQRKRAEQVFYPSMAK